MKSNQTSKPRAHKPSKAPVYQIIVDRNRSYEDAMLWCNIARSIAEWLIFLTLYFHWN